MLWLMYIVFICGGSGDRQTVSVRDSYNWPVGEWIDTIEGEAEQIAQRDAYESNGAWAQPKVHGKRFGNYSAILPERLTLRQRMCYDLLTDDDWRKIENKTIRTKPNQCSSYQMEVFWPSSATYELKSTTWRPEQVTVTVTASTVTCSARLSNIHRPCRIVFLQDSATGIYTRTFSVPLGDAPVQVIRIRQTLCLLDYPSGMGTIVVFGHEALDCDTWNTQTYVLKARWTPIAGTHGTWRCEIWTCGNPVSKFTGRGTEPEVFPAYDAVYPKHGMKNSPTSQHDAGTTIPSPELIGEGNRSDRFTLAVSWYVIIVLHSFMIRS
ncbi:t20 [Tupaiid betaherpesvirus 1]|uniref:T20 n=1 Tax=Tupaiid herpesvirus 1 (strain 1) TaxID=10397 RepID=Q91TU1_TUHV1|nr:t20 [Tupaiid betaherpesvirus 1]AAK57046.1 t20 [Tupaiid betaherpesvirus 1]